MMLLWAGAPAAARQSEPEPLTREPVKRLEVELIGGAAVKAWYRTLPAGRADDRAPWRQLVWFKKGDRRESKSYFAEVDFEAGRVTELPTVFPSMECWSQLWVGGKLYLCMNVAPHLGVYDPATGTLTDAGNPFTDDAPGAAAAPGPVLTLYSISAGPDGAIALGAGQGNVAMSVYDPKAKAFTRYGRVGPEDGQYVYSVTMDERYVYCAVRGSGPWQLVRVDRRTNERKVLATAPADKFMQVHGSTAELPGPLHQVNHRIKDGELVPPEPAAPPAGWAPAGPGFSGEVPTVTIDDAPIFSGKAALRVAIPSPRNPSAPPREAMMPVGVDQGSLDNIAALADGRIAGASRAYYPTVITDPQTGKSDLAPTLTSTYDVLAVGNRLFLTGYPSVNLWAYDADKPIVKPTGGGTPDSQPSQANPRQFASLASVTGGAHIGLGMTPAADGRVWLIARRHRYFQGFALAWFHPQTLESGSFDDAGAFNHYEIGWIAPAAGASKLLISAYPDHNSHFPGEAPKNGALFIFDVKSQKIEAKHEPLPGTRYLTGVVEAGPELVVGAAMDAEQKAGTLYRFNLKSGQTEQTRTYNTIFCERRGTLGVPVRTNEFTAGPGGEVWATAASPDGQGVVIFRIAPADLGVQPLGAVPGERVRLLFDRGRLYVSDGPTVRRVKNWSY